MPGRWKSTFLSLQERDFRYLWLGIIFMMGGIQMSSIARSYLVYEITSSPLLLGLVNIGFAVPMLILSLFGGVAADRMNRKRLIQACQALAALTSLAVAVSISIESVTWVHLFIASTINGIVFAFMVPSRQALIPLLVDKDLLTNALALNAAAFSATTLLAPAIAGSLYILIGPGGVYYLITFVEIIAVVCTGFLRYRADGIQKEKANVLKEIKEGLGYIRRHSSVKVLLVVGLLTALLAMPIRLLLPIFVVDIYHRGPESLGLLVSSMGLGALAGSLVIATMGRWRRGLVLITGGIISGISLVLLALLPIYLAAAAIMLLLGVGDSTRRALNQTLILEVVEEEYQGRVISVYAMNFGLIPLGVMPASLIAQFFGGRAAAAVLGSLLLIIFISLLFSQKKLRRMA